METVLDGSKCLVLMYVQRLGWSYVITPGMKRIGTQRWQTTLECHHVQERILNCLSCIYSWHVQFRICTRTFTITVTECVQRTGNFVTILNYTLLNRARIRARLHQQDYSILLGLQVLHHGLLVGDVQVDSGRRTGCLWKTYSLIIGDVQFDYEVHPASSFEETCSVYLTC
jgi:hypothetical protein